MNRRKFLVGTSGLLATTVLPLPSFAQAATKIKIVQSTYGFLFVPAMVAQEMSFFAQNGLDAEFTVNLGGTEALAAALSGDVDIAVEASSSAMRSRERGTEAKIFGCSCTRYASNVVISKALAEKKGIDEKSSVEHKIEALRGARIAVIGLGSGTHQLLLYLLGRGGLNPDRDLEILGIGQVSGVLASFEQGRIDGFVASSPNSDLAVLNYNGMMLFNMSEGSIPELNDYPYISYITRESWLKENPETAAKFRKAIDASLVAIHDPQQADKIRDVIHAKYHEKTDKALFDTVWSAMSQAWPQDSRITREMGEKALGFLNKVSPEPFPTTLLDSAFHYA
ncbi:ABC transporter substrate-binding protein [Mesorhizobium sp. YR577]|uniref:ABC transporter substrate-binding protein n=1 Tax=Mesorhizobium sp. YR577 TaxID=1884373 RepID=UPI0008E44824|nr:ABC transporter substrate-binding protein [Mesorhizobium sp. YR577]SFU11581.1 ABC-type nitrate/sulfonate/bicarbonate transport system, substrate-binding protein [Mesorhizobium sp. YR577]